MKPSKLRERPVWRSLCSTFASIWRIRSRATANSLPTSSRVQSVFWPIPKRIRRICWNSRSYRSRSRMDSTGCSGQRQRPSADA
jgi:hypothetical protein